MTNRRIVYPGEIPEDYDILQIQRNMIYAVGSVLQTLLGTPSTWAGAPGILFSNIECVPGSGLAVQVRPVGGQGLGIVMGYSEVDPTEFGSVNSQGGLAPDTTTVLMEGFINAPVSLSCPAPVTSGDSINYLIEADLGRVDGGNTVPNLAGQTGVVLSYFNSTPGATNPLSGPNGDGQSQNNDRIQSLNLVVKAGVAATTGSQTTPSLDTGFAGLYVVTVTNGQSSIPSGQITAYTSPQPFIKGLLTHTHTGAAGDAPALTQSPQVYTGMVNHTTSSSAPSGWLVTDGSAVSRTTYANLFGLFGTMYGAGDGSTTFNLPDGRSRSIVGAGTGAGLSARSLGATGGEENHVLVVAELASHTHSYADPGHSHILNDPGHTHNDGGLAITSGGSGDFSSGNTNTQVTGNATTGITMDTSGINITISANGSNSGHNNMHPWIAYTPIIKT